MSDAMWTIGLHTVLAQPQLVLWPILAAVGVWLVLTGVTGHRTSLAEQLELLDVDVRLRETAEARLGRTLGLAEVSLPTSRRERDLFPPALKRVLRPVFEDLGWLLRGFLLRFAPGLAGGNVLERDLRLARPGLKLSGYFAEKAGAGLAGALVLPTFAVLGGPETAPPLWLVAAAVGFLLPDLDLRRRLGARRARVADELPSILDQLVIAASAGLSLEQAIGYVARSGEGILADELRRLTAEMAYGRRASLQEALEALAERNDTPEITVLVGQLRAAHKQGVPVVRVLTAQADGLRERKRARLVEMGGKATVRMVMPIAIFILPVLAIVVLVPMAVQLMQINS
jgi:tight adherence protein C